MSEDDPLFRSTEPQYESVHALLSYIYRFINDAVGESNDLVFHRIERLQQFEGTTLPYSKIRQYCTDAIVRHQDAVDQARNLTRRLHAHVQEMLGRGALVDDVEDTHQQCTGLPSFESTNQAREHHTRNMRSMWTHIISLRVNSNLNADREHYENADDDEEESDEEEQQGDDEYERDDGFMVDDDAAIEYEDDDDYQE